MQRPQQKTGERTELGHGSLPHQSSQWIQANPSLGRGYARERPAAACLPHALPFSALGYRPCRMQRASAASLAGRHQASLAAYQSMVWRRLSAKSACVGRQPSSRRSLEASMA